MARADVTTLLPLDSWAKIMGLSLWEFNQIGEGFPDGAQPEGECGEVFFQHEWQRDRLSREEIAKTIAEAELMVADWLGFYPAPKYITGEPVEAFAQRGYAFRFGAPLLTWNSISTRYKKISGTGALARTLINDTAAVTASDPDNDSVNELFTVIANAGSITDANQIGVYFSSADRLGEAVAEKWRIRPVNISISGGTATITGHRSLLVKPIKTTPVNPEPLDVGTAGNFATTVAVYRVYTDTTQQGTAYWDYTATSMLTQPSAVTSKSLVFADDNQAEGQLFVTWDDDGTAAGFRAPDRVLANYVSGVPLVNGEMHPDYAGIVAHLATAKLTHEACGCERSNRIIAHWRRDITIGTGENDPGRPPTAVEEDCPFGYERGALWAWLRLKKKQEFNVHII